ncbi:hypothetical protein K461DRAFT_251302 [Myriangium duriaei CBS 260.36]|uniref:MI domain-containing protein n=1 Tax=Myriangium duriaei CBS 260.36 TaxID=1168546 RepID=A0A9P4JFU7_9PEZI|nr:hypothetical protein K461DRAFT_251302 [Myriangium duriaei CBS 260.36]
MSRTQSEYSGPRLPKAMSALIGENATGKGSRRSPSRAERRKMERQQKKNHTSGQSTKAPAKIHMEDSSESEAGSEDDDEENAEVDSDTEPGLENAPPPPKVSRTIRDRLAQDDADIAALERKLGIKKKSSKKDEPFDDGLEDLFGDLGEFDDEDIGKPKPKRRLAEDEEWLLQKRRKVQVEDADFEGFSDTASADGSMSGEDNEINDDIKDDFDGDEVGSGSQASDFDDESNEGELIPSKSTSAPKRENPYVAPVEATERTASVGKYIPPSLRQTAASEDEAVLRLNRRIQGLINRLSESNLLSIVQSVEALYQDHARQHVTFGIINALLALIAESSTLSDVFIVLHGAFIAALYRVTGTDFGAQLLERIVGVLDDPLATAGKKPVNLVSLLAIMYNFQVISCDIIYDLIRQFIKRFSEDDTELLLRIIRLCGPQLRQDDALALKDVVAMVQGMAAEKVPNSLSVRQSFMIEIINDLKNNRLKTGMASSASRTESTARMKKLLGTIKSKSSRASEPLRVSLDDIRSSDKKGKWWLVGASYHDPSKMAASTEVPKPQAVKEINLTTTTDLNAGNDEVNLMDLARQQGMNTDIRRSIFVAVMSAVDYKHAKIQINKLGLKKAQIEELPLVLIRCVLAENVYNPYYSYIAKEFCHLRQVKMAFQFALWDYCKRIDGQNEDEDDRQEQLDMSQIYRLAKLYAKLIRVDALSITALKKIDFLYMQPRTRLFLEVMLTSVILDKSKSWGDSSVETIFTNALDAPDMVSGFVYFLQNAVATSEVPEKRKHKEKVADVCAKAAQLLSHGPSAQMIAE